MAQCGLECHTSAVTAYHEAFWVITGTAAPVIALAVVVATPDLFPAASEAAAQADADTGGHPDYSSRTVRLTLRYANRLAFLYTVALLSLLSQILLLLAALLSVMNGRNAIPPVLGVWLAIGGLVLLCVTALVAPLWRISWRVATGMFVPRPTRPSPERSSADDGQPGGER